MPPESEEGRRGEELVIAPATTAARGESISREGGRGGEGMGCSWLGWLRVSLTDSVRVAFFDRRGVALVPSPPPRGRHMDAAQYGLKGEKRAKTTRRDAPALSLRSH